MEDRNIVETLLIYTTIIFMVFLGSTIYFNFQDNIDYREQLVIDYEQVQYKLNIIEKHIFEDKDNLIMLQKELKELGNIFINTIEGSKKDEK